MAGGGWRNSTDALERLFDMLCRVHFRPPRPAAEERKLRLFMCALCRCLWHLFDEYDRGAVEVSERYVDGQATVAELRVAWWAVWSDEGRRPQVPAWRVASSEASPAEAAALKAVAEAEVALGRDIVGNPLPPGSILAAWRTDAVVALARQMYESRDFSPMPILADALQDAGCDSTDILDHCRDPGPHVRGCWCVDLILGKL